MLFDRWHGLGSPGFHIGILPVLGFLLGLGKVLGMVAGLYLYIGLIEIWSQKFPELIKCLPIFLVHLFGERHFLCAGQGHQLIVDLQMIIDFGCPKV